MASQGIDVRRSPVEYALGSQGQKTLSRARGCFISRRADLRGCQAAHGSGATGIPWTQLVLLRSVGMKQERGHRVVPLPCPMAGGGQEHPPPEDHQDISLSSDPSILWGSLLISCGLIHLIYRAKLWSERPFWFICLESSWHSPGTV